MSKQRPSRATAASAAPGPSAGPGEPGHRWLRRVFHNTYTRRGRLIALRGWSVKIQQGGERRTFSLAAKTRSGAAAEARAIQEDLWARGWEAVQRQYRGRKGQAFRRTDTRYWKERLLLRNYPAPAEGKGERQFSTHIEHAGSGWYFPLGTRDTEAAALRALGIYRQVVEDGWDTAEKAFAREVTVAFHWAYDPLLWTYTTVHTSPGADLDPPYRGAGNARGQILILLIERDSGLRNALAQWINKREGYGCVACATAGAGLRQSAAQQPALCLVNRDVTDSVGLANSNQIGAMAEGIPAVSYGVHVDSEELFALTPGGASGYVLKRTAPERLLEPVLGVLSVGQATAETLLQSSRSYFQRLLQVDPAGKTCRKPAPLTQREQEVLNLMSKGYVDKEIAPALGISAWTVHGHVKRIFEKLKVHSRTEAVLAYLQK